MIKADIARIVYETHGGISYQEAKELVEVMLKSMKEHLARGENVKLSGFGSLKIVNRKDRMGRNPQTGERILIPSSNYVSFHPSRRARFP